MPSIAAISSSVCMTFDQTIADLLRDLDEDVALELLVDHLPDDGALLERQRFQQAGEFGRVQVAEQRASTAHFAAVDASTQFLEIGQLVLAGFHGIRPPRSRDRARVYL